MATACACANTVAHVRDHQFVIACHVGQHPIGLLFSDRAIFDGFIESNFHRGFEGSREPLLADALRFGDLRQRLALRQFGAGGLRALIFSASDSPCQTVLYICRHW